MHRLVLLITMCLTVPGLAFADGDEEDEDMDFLDIEHDEKTRKAKAADRAPAENVFLDDDDDEDPDWDPPSTPTEVDGDDPDEDEDPDGPLLTESDEDEDPVNDLSPADRASIMRPLADNFPLALVSKHQSQVTVELPVLVAQSEDDFQGQDFWVVAQVVVNGTPISEGRHLVTRSSIVAIGPTKVWFKLSAPVDGPEADVEVRISKQPARSGRAQPLFSRSLTVRM